MTKKLLARIHKEFRQLNTLVMVVIVFAFIMLLVASYLLITDLIAIDSAWLPGLIAAIAGILFVLVGILIYFLIDSRDRRVRKLTSQTVNTEMYHLRAAQNRAKSLQSMASVMRATLSFERVVEEALNACSLAVEDMGVAHNSIVGAVFLYHGRQLDPVATRRFHTIDEDKPITAREGMVADALNNAEMTTTDAPHQDPELRQFMAYQNCTNVICIPLRAGFQIYGAVVMGIQQKNPLELDETHIQLFNAVADQAVIALQNAQLYQRLEAEKQRILEADEEARKELARDLHDGPTQSIAAIAMRINFIRSLMSKDPEQALQEMAKVEHLAKQTSKEIRGMLFTLRPLVLETQGLTAAVESVITNLQEQHGLNIRLIGGENGDLLNDAAQGIVFSIVEEALGNARKYAEAKQISVRFWQEDNLFVAMIRDNGKGFNVQEVNSDYSSRGSLGMINMRERADRIDGSLKLESQVGVGTSVMLVVPLAKHGRQVLMR